MASGNLATSYPPGYVPQWDLDTNQDACVDPKTGARLAPASVAASSSSPNVLLWGLGIAGVLVAAALVLGRRKKKG